MPLKSTEAAFRFRPADVTNESLTIVIPKLGAPAQNESQWGYVSPGTQSLVIKISGASFYAANLTATSPGCTGSNGVTTCHLSSVSLLQGFGEPVEVDLHDATQQITNGSINGSPRGKLLSFGARTLNIGTSRVNISVRLNPIVESVTGGLAITKPLAGTKANLGLLVQAYDADNYLIPAPNSFYEVKDGQVIARQIAVRISAPVSTIEFASHNHLLGTDYGFYKTNDVPQVVYLGRGAHSATLRVDENPVITILPKPTFEKPFTIPSVGQSTSFCIGAKKKIWFTKPAAHALAWVSFTEKAVHEIPLPSGQTPGEIACYGARSDYDVAFTESANGIGVAKGAWLREFTIDTPNSDPYRMAVNSFFNTIWFTERRAGKIGLLTLPQGHYSQVQMPKGSAPSGIVMPMRFTDPGRNAVGSLIASSKVFERVLPHPDSGPDAIADTEYYSWFTEDNAPRIGQWDRVSGKLVEFPTRAILRGVTTAQDDWAYAIDARDNVELVDPEGHLTILHNPVPDTRLVAIVGGDDSDLWILTSGPQAGAVTELIY